MSFRIINRIVEAFPDSIHVGQVNLLATADQKIFEFAKKNNYTIVTYDEDFHALSVLRGFPPKIIWIRAGSLPTSQLAQLLIMQKIVISYFLNESGEEEYGCLELFV